jgi:hypothetical protein
MSANEATLTACSIASKVDGESLSIRLYTIQKVCMIKRSFNQWEFLSSLTDWQASESGH